MKFNYDQYKTLEEKAKWFAFYHHGVTLHMRGNKTYHESHLTDVVGVAKRFIDCVEEQWRDAVLAACWMHDAIEDARVTYNDIKSIFPAHVVEIVYALTNEKGRNRKDRANHIYYAGIRATRYATFVKLCDRIANIEDDGHMVDMYRQEQAAFVSELYVHNVYNSMWAHIENLLTKKRIVPEVKGIGSIFGDHITNYKEE